MTNSAAKLYHKINAKTAKVAIIGVGYVGETLAKATASCGFFTVGFDIDRQRVKLLNRYKTKNFLVTSNPAEIDGCEIICICVPTPIDKNKKPNLSDLRSALLTVSKYLTSGMLVILESSVAPGTTRNFVLPILEKASGLICGKQFFLSFSSERIDPGNTKFNLKNTPKVVGGIETNSQKLAIKFYSQFIEKVINVTSVEVAEMSKVLENVFRFVNISLINEIKTYTDAAGVDIWEAVRAASTKPFGFLPHYPGPGVGGHCIPVLPYYLIDAAKKRQIPLRIVEAAGVVNDLQPKIIAEKAAKILDGKLTKNGKTTKALLVGISYKPGTADIRGSPGLKIWKLLENRGFAVSYYDPMVPRVNGSSSCRLTKKTLTNCDLVIITTPHKNIPYQKLLKFKKPVIDTRNVLKGIGNFNTLSV